MTEKAISLADFLLDYPLWGKYQVAYTNDTHLDPGCWIDLCSVEVQGDEQQAKEYPVLPFLLRHNSKSELEGAIKNTDGSIDAEDAARIIHDQLKESMIRCGIILPQLEIEEACPGTNAWRELAKHTYLILVTDTSALRRGIITLVSTTIPTTVIWTVIPVFSLMEVQWGAESIQSIHRAGKNVKHYRILRQQPQVTCAAREINIIKAERPVEFLQAPSQLIGHVRGFTPDSLRSRKDTLRDPISDRLIIESVKNLKRERGIQHGVFLVTADKDMAAVAQLENVDSLYVGLPELPDPVISIRYNPLSLDPKHSFVVCPLHHFLWDLTHVFSQIQLKNVSTGKCYELVYFSKHRRNWSHDVLGLREC